MPLNITVAPEHPDVTALKDTVRRVAMKYAKQHSWCAVVKRALVEAGVDSPAEKIQVEIEFSVLDQKSEKVVRRLNVSDLAGKTAEEQNAFVAEQFAPTMSVLGKEVKVPMTVLDLNEVSSVAVTARVTREIPVGHTGKFVSSDGRVKHIVADSGGGWGARRTYFLCGTYTYDAKDHSDRDEGRVCSKCLDRVH